MKRFVYFQPNEKNSSGGAEDCVIRALCRAFDRTWLEVFDELTDAAREQYHLPTSREVFETILKKHGYEYWGLEKDKRCTVNRFAAQHEDGIYILLCRAGLQEHLVTVADGLVYDNRDGGNREVKGFYRKNCTEGNGYGR